MIRAREILFWFAASASTALMLAPQSSDAQSDAEILADLRACSALERNGARLACFDGVFAAEHAAQNTPAPIEGNTVNSTVAEPSRGAAALNEPVEPSSTKDDGPRTVMIVGVNAELPGATRFVTDAGQVLVQTSGSTPRGGYPDVPFQATLEDGALGSLFLGISERRRVRVRLAD